MSLLEDLQSIDVSAVVNARGEITLSVSGDDLQALIDGQGITAALADLGGAIDALQNAQQDPQALLVPLVEAVSDLAGLFDTDDIDLAKYIDAVREAAQIVAQVFASIGSGDPSQLTLPDAGRLGDVLNHAANFNDHFSKIGLSEATGVKSLIESVEQGFPSDPVEFAMSAVDILMPFSASTLISIRSSVDSLIKGSGRLSVDTQINSGLLAGLERIRIAAEAGDAIEVNRELNQLAQIRDNTLNAIRGALRQGTAFFQSLDIDRHITVIEQFSDAFRINPEGALEFMQGLADQLEATRTSVETLALPEIGPIIENIVTQAEQALRSTIEQPIDRLVAELKTWLRDQLGYLNLRYYRGQLTQFFLDVERAIRSADLDGPARQARAFLDEIENVIGNVDVGAQVQAALGDIATTINTAIDGIQTALQNIVDGVNAAAAAAQNTLEQVANQLEAFQQTIDGITQTAEQLGIEQARDAVIAAIEDLKEIAETILGVAPLPDAMRPVVEDVIQELDQIDVNEVLSPVFDALGNLTIPPSVLDPINEVLTEAANVIENLITESLIASLEDEFQSAIDELNKFDPGNLLEEVTQYVDQAAEFLDGLDPRPIVEEIRAPYDAVLHAVEAIHPNRLLRPIIEAYEGVFSSLEMQDPLEAVDGLNDTLNQAGEEVGQTLSAPITQLTGQTARRPGEETAEEGPPTDLAEVRPGDIVRLLGFIPNKLREALQALDAGPVGEVIDTLDSLCSGLARDLRRVQQALWNAERDLFNGIEALLRPLGSAQIQAQLAIQAGFSVDVDDGGAEIDVNASMQLLGSISAGAMRRELMQELTDARRAIAALIGRSGGSTGSFMDRLAGILEDCALGQISGDLDALLAALDPEPIAAELDAVARAAINRLPEIAGILDSGVQDAIGRLFDLVQQFNPVAQGIKFLEIFDVIREELELLNPRRLAAELGEIHGAIRDVILAYDPAAFAQEIYEVVETVAAQIRALDPGALLGDLTQFNNLSASLESLNPATALADIDGQLDEVGARLTALDMAGLLDAVNDLPPRLETSVTEAGQAIIDNLKSLLESIKYFSGVSATVSVEVASG